MKIVINLQFGPKMGIPRASASSCTHGSHMPQSRKVHHIDWRNFANVNWRRMWNCCWTIFKNSRYRTSPPGMTQTHQQHPTFNSVCWCGWTGRKTEFERNLHELNWPSSCIGSDFEKWPVGHYFEKHRVLVWCWQKSLSGLYCSEQLSWISPDAAGHLTPRRSDSGSFIANFLESWPSGGGTT